MPTIWALGDLHLSLALPDKSMDVFGETWVNHPQKIKEKWNGCVLSEDLVLLPGDISWATHLKEAMIDLEWIDALPGQKMMIRGNHDYWWPSLSKLQQILPPSIQAIHNNSLTWNGVAIGGARLWDTPEYNFNSFIEFRENPFQKEKKHTKEEIAAQNAKIFQREIERLKLSLKTLDSSTNTRIIMTHYPPISADLKPSVISTILEKHQIDHCVFGHLHNVKPNSLPFGEKNGVHYTLTSGDYVQFHPVEVFKF